MDRVWLDFPSEEHEIRCSETKIQDKQTIIFSRLFEIYRTILRRAFITRLVCGFERNLRREIGCFRNHLRKLATCTNTHEGL